MISTCTAFTGESKTDKIAAAIYLQFNGRGNFQKNFKDTQFLGLGREENNLNEIGSLIQDQRPDKFENLCSGLLNSELAMIVGTMVEG